MSELVLALPQLSGDRAVEVSRESVVIEGSLASGLEKQKGWMTGRAGLETGALGHQWPFCLPGGLGGGCMSGSFPSISTSPETGCGLPARFSFPTCELSSPSQALRF